MMGDELAQQWVSMSVKNGATSCWWTVTSDVLKGSVIGPVLFNNFINYLDTGVGCNLSGFADVTEQGCAADFLEEQRTCKGI